MSEIERLEAILRHTAAERCRLGGMPYKSWPRDPAVEAAISAEIEANAILDHQTRERLKQLENDNGKAF